MTDVLFPHLSTEQPEAEGIVSTWFVNDGETVVPGQLIAEVAVDKVDQEVLSPVGGVIAVMIPEGATARQGAVIGRVS